MISPTPQEDPPAAGRERYEMPPAGPGLPDQGITVFDRELRLLAWNDSFLRLLDFPPAMAFAGAAFESFIRFNARRGEYGPGDVDCQTAERVERARSFLPHAVERIRPDGRILHMRGEPLPGGGFVTLYTDITEQRYIDNLIHHRHVGLEERVRRRTAQLENANASLLRANEEKSSIAAALQRSEARLRLINDTIPTLIGYFDRHEIFRYANKGYADWFQAAEVTGRAVSAVIGLQVYEQVREHVRTALSGRQVTYEYAMWRNGQTCHARSTLVPEIGPAGDTLGCFVFSYDITDQKRMQAALAQAQKMEAIGQLTGGLAHDFNNLLTVVIGNLAALQEHRPDDAGVRDFVEPALQSARRGAQLIKRLLTYSRQQPLEPRIVDAGRLIGGMATLIRRSLPESIAIDLDLPAAPVFLQVDPAQFESALLNFALNARDAMPDGGRLGIAVRPLLLAAGQEDFALAPGHYVLVEVADTGTGMEAATLARVFEPFFTTKRFGLGSGLGLSMVHGFVQQSGGDIRILSAPGRGTTVRLALPASRPESADPEAVAERRPAQRGGLVLLVEDEASVRRVVRQQLVELGHPVIEAENGAQALELLEHVPDIAIVLTDVVMPGGINGRQLARGIAAERGVRVLLMSGYADGAGCEAPDSPPMLAKPFDRKDLEAALHALLAGRAPAGADS